MTRLAGICAKRRPDYMLFPGDPSWDNLSLSGHGRRAGPTAGGQQINSLLKLEPTAWRAGFGQDSISPNCPLQYQHRLLLLEFFRMAFRLAISKLVLKGNFCMNVVTFISCVLTVVGCTASGLFVLTFQTPSSCVILLYLLITITLHNADTQTSKS